MIIFRKLKWKNLLSTGNYFTEINLCGVANTLVVGENGAGKSTMLDALCFALFGKPFRSINKPSLVNSINGKECVVEVEFDSNNKSYRVVRGIKPNVFQIYCNGELLNQDAALRDYQEHLEKFILKLNYKSFTQIVILGSASFVPFMQLSASDRRAIIEDLLDIQIFSTMNGLVKNRLSNNKDIITNKKHDYEMVEQKFQMQKKHIEELKQNNQDKVREYDGEIQSHSDTVSSFLEIVIRLTQETEQLQLVVANKIETEDKVKKITKLESQIESNLSKFRKDIGFFQSHDNCPTCRQAIASEFKEEELANLSDKATECEHGLTQLEQRLNLEQEKLNQINEKQKLINKKQVEIATYNTTITETNKMIARLQKLTEELKNSKTVSDKEEQELGVLKQTLNDLKSDITNMLIEKSYLEVASGLLKDTGIKTKIVKQYLPVINKLVNKYLASLDFFVNFNLDESFKETIKSRHRDEFTYNNFSEGEKQRIDMALMLTWRAVAKLKNSSNTNLLILDETFDSSLDANGTEELMKILHMLEGVNLFVISHKGDILQDKFMNVVRFVKEKNFSRIAIK
jgi:DNA repair exonuclease SbcCD ATPase subunit